MPERSLDYQTFLPPPAKVEGHNSNMLFRDTNRLEVVNESEHSMLIIEYMGKRR